MLPIDFEQHGREWIAAWNAHDLDRILAHYSADVEFRSPFVAKLTGRSDCVVRGTADLREYFSLGLKAYPALKFELVRVYPGAQSCVLEYLSVNELRAAETLEFNADGKICRVLAHYRRRNPQ